MCMFSFVHNIKCQAAILTLSVVSCGTDFSHKGTKNTKELWQYKSFLRLFLLFTLCFCLLSSSLPAPTRAAQYPSGNRPPPPMGIVAAAAPPPPLTAGASEDS